MGRAALAATLSVSLAWASCYAPIRAPTTDDDVRLWRSRVAERQTKRLPQKGRIDAQTAVKLALEHSPRLRQANAMIAIAKAQVDRVGQPRNPEIRVNNLDLDRLIEQDPSVELSLRVPIPVPGRLAALRGAAQAEVQQQIARRNALARQVAGDVRRLLVDMAELQGHIELSSERLAIQQSWLSNAEAGLARNLVPAAQVSRRQLEVSLEKDRGDELQGRLRGLQARLASWIGVARDHPVTLALRPLPPAHRVPLERLTKRALEASGRREHSAWGVAAARSQLLAERTESWPWFDFAQLGYTFRSPAHEAAFGLAFAIRIPIFHQNSGGIRQAQAELSRAQLAREEAVMAVARDVDERYQRFLESHTRHAALVEGPLAAAQRYAGEVGKGVKAGLRPPETLFRAKLRRIEVQQRVLGAQIAIRRSYAALVVMVGEAAFVGAP